ncbi:MAG: B12-binding domain-containing radical SAM protein [Elusimicrobiota bacterium]
MRVLFVNRIFGAECLGRMPLGILYISAALKKDGHDVSIADACRPESAFSAVESFRPDVVMYSVRTGYHRYYARLNRELKRRFPDVLSVFGGPHATFYPEMIESDADVDAVCIGEGELAACDFMERLATGGDHENTPNFWVRRGGVIRRNAVRPLIADMDSIAVPDRDLLAAYPGVRGFPIRSFIASRGCPYDCSYCFNHAYSRIYEEKGSRVRLPSAAAFVREIAGEFAKAPFESLHFEDDIFGLSPRWMDEFARIFPAEVGLPFSCSVRAELVTERLADQLARSGCASVWMGLESGDEKVRIELLDRSNTDAVTRVAIERLRRRGIVVCTENIIGIPTTSLEQDFQTLRLNLELKPDYMDCSIFQPYPKTDLGQVAVDAGLFSGDFDQLGDFYEGTSLNTPNKRELANLQALFVPTLLMPGLYPFLPRLVRLPLHPLYRLINLLIKVYMMTQKLYRVRLRPAHLRYAAQLFSVPLGPSLPAAVRLERPAVSA